MPKNGFGYEKDAAPFFHGRLPFQGISCAWSVFNVNNRPTMLTLHFYKNGDRTQTLRFDKKTVVLGRSAPADIILQDPTISKSHCILTQKPEGWMIEDTSRNGIALSGGESVNTRMKLQLSKRYHLGKVYSFEANTEDLRPVKELTVALTHKPTQLLKVDEASSEITLGTAHLSVTLPDGQCIQKKVEQTSLSIGSHDSNDFSIPSDAVSLFHARLDFIDHRYVFSDLGSTNGSRINQVRVERAILNSNCEVELGSLKLQFSIQTEKKVIQPKDCLEFCGMVSKNKTMQKVFATIEIVAQTDAPVMVSGETGTGKELVARSLHQLSRRFNKPFIALNCAALPKDTIESELFGHERGAFTGAISDRIGAFEAAHQGSLFLDEIGDLPLELQSKLLRVLEIGEIKRLGSNRIIPTSVRVIAATHKNLKQEVQLGNFREDLLYRLVVAPIYLPPLRDRKDDIELLTPYLLQKIHPSARASLEVVEALRNQNFPGNIRELKNILQRAVIEYELQGGGHASSLEHVLELRHFQFIEEFPRSKGPKTTEEKQDYERILKALGDCDGSQTRAAKLLEMPTSTLNDRIKRYGIDPKPKI